VVVVWLWGLCDFCCCCGGGGGFVGGGCLGSFDLILGWRGSVVGSLLPIPNPNPNPNLNLVLNPNPHPNPTQPQPQPPTPLNQVGSCGHHTSGHPLSLGPATDITGLDWDGVGVGAGVQREQCGGGDVGR